MRILTDTNILFSALLFPDSKPAQALLRVAERHTIVLCDKNIEELKTILARKAPAFLPAAEELLSELPYELIPAARGGAHRMRDAKDMPILNAAAARGVDIIITGDKDFPSLNIAHPRCMTAAQFLASEGID